MGKTGVMLSRGKAWDTVHGKWCFWRISYYSPQPSMAMALEELVRQEKELSESNDSSRSKLEQQKAVRKDTRNLSEELDSLSERSPERSRENIQRLQEESKRQLQDVDRQLEENIRQMEQETGGSGQSEEIRNQQQQIQNQIRLRS